METNFSIGRVAALVMLLVLFWLLGGFNSPDLPPDSFHSPLRVRKAWTYGVMMFLGGSYMATLVDHYTGNLDRTNLRFAYLIMGCILMASSVLWIRHLKEAAATNRITLLPQESLLETPECQLASDYFAK